MRFFSLEVPLIVLAMGRQELYWASSNFSGKERY